VLIRHAKSSWEDPDLADFDRPLNARGERDAPRMARRLKEKQLHPARVLCSPSVRTLQTCHAFRHVLKFTEDAISFLPALYHASAEELFYLLQQLPDSQPGEVVFVFGHNPGLTEFANRLFAQHIDNVPTCGILWGHLRVTAWKGCAQGVGKLQWFDFPKSKHD